MLDYKEQIQSVYDVIKRSETEQKYAYAYEILLLTGTEQTVLTSRTSGSLMFNQDIESAVGKAKQANGILRVNVYGGKSANAREQGSYTINVGGRFEQPTPEIERAEIESIVKEEVKQQQQQKNDNTNGFGQLDTLLGLFSGDNPQMKSKLEGLFGLFSALSGTGNNGNTELERLNYQKQLDDFKYETRYDRLQEKYEYLKDENQRLKDENGQYSKENKELNESKSDLETRLARYAPQEVMTRLGIGAVATMGSRLLTNSPKAAQAIGLTPQEFKAALGVVDEIPGQAQTDDEPLETGVEITEVGNDLSPEEKQKAEIIRRLSEVMQDCDLATNTKIINIVATCLDHIELMDKTLAFLRKMLHGNKEDIENK